MSREPPTTWLEAWKARARSLKREVHALYLASRDPRVPWYAKVLIACIVAYALSPIDLIPDPIPVLGYLDDLVLLPLGVLAVRRMIPTQVLEECRAHARDEGAATTSARWIVAAVIVAIWFAAAAAVLWWCWHLRSGTV